mmetsp:Transcript_27883/g.64785  ORF Transcript_27883/g.64785 Transcript_27883/m.64785 type:complete len:328 (-) Transcript_27883:88-1071(-)
MASRRCRRQWISCRRSSLISFGLEISRAWCLVPRKGTNLVCSCTATCGRAMPSPSFVQPGGTGAMWTSDGSLSRPEAALSAGSLKAPRGVKGTAATAGGSVPLAATFVSTIRNRRRRHRRSHAQDSRLPTRSSHPSRRQQARRTAVCAVFACARRTRSCGGALRSWRPSFVPPESSMHKRHRGTLPLKRKQWQSMSLTELLASPRKRRRPLQKRRLAPAELTVRQRSPNLRRAGWTPRRLSGRERSASPPLTLLQRNGSPDALPSNLRTKSRWWRPQRLSGCMPRGVVLMVGSHAAAFACAHNPLCCGGLRSSMAPRETIQVLSLLS